METTTAEIIIQILLGGITRLSGSGLSITEWEPVKGALPPLTEQQWIIQFEKYKQTPQFHLLNFDFTLSDFKFIYFWEWFHRVWARLMGVVFAIGFVYFLVKKQFKKEMILPMVLLFLLGALQGAIGWIMVKSGLNEENLYVNHIRLAIHFIAALGLCCYVFWFALDLLVDSAELRAPDRVCREIFQIYREALNNIKKHAKATHVVVKLSQDDSRLLLVVDDNGEGFSFAGKFTGDELDRLRLGPISIKERTRTVNGDLTVESNPGHGARLTIEIPLG